MRLVLGILLWCGLELSLMAAPQFVSVTAQSALLRVSPNATAEIRYSAYPGIVFEVVSVTDDFYQVMLFDESVLWISAKEVQIYTGSVPPPVAILGVVTPIRPTVETPVVAMASTDDIKGALAELAALPTENLSMTTPSENSGFGSAKIRDFLGTDLARSESLDTLALPTPSVTASVSTKKRSFLRLPPVYTYLPVAEEVFIFPPRPVSHYPQLDVSGYYEMKISGRDYAPKLSAMTATDNRWNIIQHDPVYTKLPYDVLVGSPKFDMRFKFNIDGKLADDLAVHYDVEQEPDFPGKYDVRINYQRQELTFFHLDADFQNGEFVNYRKALNGAKYQITDPNWSAIVALGKQRSEPKKYESFGNGRKSYNVGVKSLLYESLRVWVNNTVLREGVDYTVDYYQGDINFSSVKNSSDYIEVVYEFTNPIEDFIPVLSKKNFLGAQFVWKATPQIEEVRRVLPQHEEFVITPSTNANWVGSMNIDLKSTAVVLGSEDVILNGIRMRSNSDYVIRNRKGRLAFIRRALSMGDQVTVNYQSYDTVDGTDDLIGQDTAGPYQLSRKNILEDSVTVYLDRKRLNQTIDYELNEDTGQIRFSYPISYPSIISVTYTAVKTEAAATRNAFGGSPINFGITYLDEYAKGQTDDLVLSAASENIIATANTFTVAFNPIVDLDKLVMTVNGNLVVSGDYQLVNPYLGQFRLVSPSSSVNSVSVSYHYRKSFQTTAVFQGTGEKYYTNNAEFTLRDVPVKFNGIQKVRVYNGFVDEELTPVQDYTVDYGTDGNSIKITFYKKQEFNPFSPIQSIRPDYPGKGQRITLVYDHAPDSATDSGTISQKQLGLTFGAQISPRWRVDTELSMAENNFDKPRLQGEFNGVGKGGAEVYTIGQRNLIENSETLYVDNVPLTKDQQYSINYINGTLRFINLNPQAANKIRMTFSYIDPNGQTQAGASKGFKMASKIATQFSDGPWTVRGDIKSIDKDYVPISPIQLRKGTTSFGGAVEYRRSEENLASVEYHRNDEYQTPTDVRDNVYIHTDDVIGRLNTRLFDTVDVRQNARYVVQYEDATHAISTGNIFRVDVANFNWDTAIGFGSSDSRHTFSRSYGRTVDGVFDGYNRRNSESDAIRWTSEFTLKKLVGLGDSYFKPNYEYSVTRVQALDSATGTLNSSQSYRRAMGINSRYQPTPVLDASLDASTEEQNSQSNGVVGTPNRITNYRFDSNFKPYSWFNTGLAYGTSEEFSPLLGQKGRFSQDIRYRVGTFGPYGLLTSAGFKGTELLVAPLKNSFFTYDFGQTTSRENDDQRNMKNESQTIAYNSFSPVPGFILTRAALSTQLSNTLDTAQTQTASLNSTNRKYQMVSATMGYRPALPILDLFNYGLTLESKRESQDTRITATISTSNQTFSDNPYDKRVQSLSFDPGKVVVGIPGILMIDLGPFRTNLEESLLDTVSYQRVLQSFGGQVTQNIAQDNSDNYAIKGDVTLKPFNLFDLSSTAKLSKDTYSRNLSLSNQGLTYRVGEDLDVRGGYAPFSFISFSAGYTFSQADQYRSPSLNMGIDRLQEDGIRTDDTLFTDYLKQRRYGATIGSVFTPFSFISFKGGAEISKIRDALIATGSESVQLFTQRVGTLGLEFRPFTGLSTGYDYSLRFTQDQSGSSSKGYTGHFTVNYLPFQTDNFKVSLTYSRDDNWGRALNALQQKETQNGTGDRIRYEVVDRKDTVELGSLSINIIIPFKGNPYLENLVITGEGQIKRVTDEYDAMRKETGQQQIGYEISGLVLKATINF